MVRGELANLSWSGTTPGPDSGLSYAIVVRPSMARCLAPEGFGRKRNQSSSVMDDPTFHTGSVAESY